MMEEKKAANKSIKSSTFAAPWQLNNPTLYLGAQLGYTTTP